MFYTIDLETYYDDEYSLSKLPTWQYVTDPRFELICAVVIPPTGGLLRFKDETFIEYLKSIQDKKYLLAHNTAFDGAIMSWRYGITFDEYFDTMLLARPYNAAFRSCSLSSLVEHYNVGKKGYEVASAKGVRRGQFGPKGIEVYLDYCQNDTVLTLKLFNALHDTHNPPKTELKAISNVLRCYIEPRIVLDKAKLQEYALDVVLKNEEKMQALGVTEKELRSDAIFATLLASEGIDPPTKINKKGETKYAFAKSDEEFMSLREDENETVSLLVNARLGVKTTIEQSRTQRLIEVANSPFLDGRLPVPLYYWKAHTGRHSGWDKINLQNLKKGTPIRDSLVAPPEYTFVVCDSSQIEARINAWISNQYDLVNMFKRGEDPYSAFASKLFNCLVRKPRKDDPPDIYKDLELKRFIGKTCILGLGYGMGATKLRNTIIAQSTIFLGRKVDIGQELAERATKLYRTENSQIKDMWYQCDNALLAQITGHSYDLGHGIIMRDRALHLPNGMPIYYPLLRKENDQFIYTTKRSKGSEDKYIWGGTVVENICQSLAGAIIRFQWNKLVKEGINVVHQVHDELVSLVKTSELEEKRALIESCMRTVPDWMMPELITCESNIGQTYGEAK